MKIKSDMGLLFHIAFYCCTLFLNTLCYYTSALCFSAEKIRKQIKKMIIIFGPTGTGKTDFASALAAQLPAEIINMDIGSFYTPLSIGTAKPDWSASLVPHHLFDILNSPVNYTVAQYRTDIIRLISDI